MTVARIMAMAAIWAPVNEITCGYFAGLGWMIRTGTFDVTIGLWAAGFVALNLLQLLWGSLTGLLHLMGAAFGAPLAIVLALAALLYSLSSTGMGLMVQVPAETMVTVVPETVQTPVVAELYEMVKLALVTVSGSVNAASP